MNTNRGTTGSRGLTSWYQSHGSRDPSILDVWTRTVKKKTSMPTTSSCTPRGNFKLFGHSFEFESFQYKVLDRMLMWLGIGVLRTGR